MWPFRKKKEIFQIDFYENKMVIDGNILGEHFQGTVFKEEKRRYGR
jgi:hypothetical protein